MLQPGRSSQVAAIAVSLHHSRRVGGRVMTGAAPPVSARAGRARPGV